MKKYTSRVPRELMRAQGKITEKDRVVITIQINKEIPLTVFQDMVNSCKAALWEYIDERKQHDENWEEVSAFD